MKWLKTMMRLLRKQQPYHYYVLPSGLRALDREEIWQDQEREWWIKLVLLAPVVTIVVWFGMCFVMAVL